MDKEEALKKIDEISRVVLALHISLLNRKYKYVEKDFEEYKKGMPENQIEYIKNSIVIDKFFDFLIKNNKIG